MRRIARVTAALLLAVGLVASPAVAAEPPIQVLLQGSPIQFDAEPFVANSRTLVPLRALSERMGFNVGWLEVEQRITLTKGETMVILWIGRTEAEVNGQRLTLDVAPVIQNDRTFVPLRFISEHLGAHVFWDGAKRHVRVTPHGESDPEALAWLDASPAMPEHRTLTKGEFHFKMIDPTSAPVELSGTLQMLTEGQNSLGGLSLMAPLFGSQTPVGSLQVAIRDGFSWMKTTGAIAQQGAPTDWQPLGSTGSAGGSLTITPEQLNQLVSSLKDQIGVTFGTIQADGMVQIDVDLGRVRFDQLLGSVPGQPTPVAEFAPMKAKLSLLIEAESKHVRGMTLDATITAPPGQSGSLEMHLQMTIDPTEQAITWPADLPANPAVPAGGVEPMPLPNPDGND